METFEEARIADGITRAEMAKMISVYVEKIP
jgi:DNA-binding XRE family transcriptional regulator